MDLEKNLKIYQVFHKPFKWNQNCEWIQPIGVNGFKDYKIIGDDSGDNISIKNSQYCELTVQYWMWKNAPEKYLGLCHYRRIFNFVIDESSFAGTPFHNDSNAIDYLSSDIQYKNLSDILDVYDVVVSKEYALGMSINEQYLAYCQPAPWMLFMKALEMKYPNQKSMLKYFDIHHSAPMCNMFVMKREIFIEYCQDLFEIVDVVHALIRAPFNEWNNRYPGFLAERFLGFWLHIKGIAYHRSQIHQIN